MQHFSEQNHIMEKVIEISSQDSNALQACLSDLGHLAAVFKWNRHFFTDRCPKTSLPYTLATVWLNRSTDDASAYNAWRQRTENHASITIAPAL
jgi:hypothetical protein